MAITIRPGSGEAQRLTERLVELIDRDRLSVVAAASGVALALAAKLVCLRAVELEAAESELEERLEDIDRQCPNEDWWSYTERQRNAIFRGKAVPSRIVRELVEDWQRRTGGRTNRLAHYELGITGEALRRSLGMVAISGYTKRKGDGAYRYAPALQKTITVEAAARIVRAIEIPPCEVPGL